ncbi:unnamed protein product [Closterium sp. Naga37s-1]|nr:unnamed protein product [Closterium sp. Naga37s-1]
MSRLSHAAATSLATVTKLRPSPAAADPRARARPRHLPFPAAACRAASEIPRPSSSPTAPAGRLSTPPRFAPLAAGRAFPPNWTLPRVPLPAASSDWMRVARPLRLPCASPACLAIVRRLRPAARRRRRARPSPAASCARRPSSARGLTGCRSHRRGSSLAARSPPMSLLLRSPCAPLVPARTPQSRRSCRRSPSALCSS